jgi:hypothetical protein
MKVETWDEHHRYIEHMRVQFSDSFCTYTNQPIIFFPAFLLSFRTYGSVISLYLLKKFENLSLF